MKKLFVIAMLALSFLTTGCQRIETGHAGIRVNFNGTYDPQPLSPGLHQTIIGSVMDRVANEMTIEMPDLKPQTKDKTVMHDIDLAFTYTVNPASIVELESNFKGRNLVAADGNVYPVGQYVANVVTTATSDIISRYDALEVNDNREKIRGEILNQTQALLKKEGLDDNIKVKQIFVKNMQISPKLTDSALAAIAAENELKAKTIQVSVAEQENKRLAMMSGNSQNMKYYELENQRMFIEKMGANTTYVIPSNMTSFMINK